MRAFISYAENRFVTELTPLIAPAFKTLLETKHLYQSVEIPTEKIHGAGQRVLDCSPSPTNSRPDAADFIYSAGIVFAYPWLPNLEQTPTVIDLLGNKGAQPKVLKFSLPLTVHTYCRSCKNRWPFNPVLGLGRVETGYSTFNQWFFLAYQCQACKGDPVRFLVRRENARLRLTGRDPFEEVPVPDVLPKEQREYFSSAMVAHNAGQPLAAIFFLRVFIEQFWRTRPQLQDRLKVDERMTGDQLGDAYSATLPGDFKQRFPSLTDIYGKLSAAVHSARAPDLLYEQISSEIVRHFEARRLFNIREDTTSNATTK